MRHAEKWFLLFSVFCSLFLLGMVIHSGLNRRGIDQPADVLPAETTSGQKLPDETEGVFPQESEGPETGQQKEEPEEETTEQTEQKETENKETEKIPELIIEVETASEEEDPYPYYIRVNRKMNCITIYTKDAKGEYTVPIRAMICSTGAATPLGVFGSKEKYLMKGLINNVYGQYSTWITGNILFHSVPSARPTKNSISVRNYNQLGTRASAGCIRLTVADAKWIYDNCAIGTLIEIYDGDEAGPLGKPEAIKLPEGSKWDPTDPDPENPWHSCNPSIQTAVKRVIEKGEIVSILEGVRAFDTCRNDITDQLETEGSIDYTKPGEYTITYRVTDVLGRNASASATYTVIETQKKPTEERKAERL